MTANTIDLDRLAAEIAPRRLLTPQGKGLLDGEVMAIDYVDVLIARGLSADAIRFVSAWLPPREAIWWGCLCVQLSADPDQQRVEELATLGAIAAWLAKGEPRCKVATPETIPTKAASRLARAALAASNPKAAADVLIPNYVSAAILGTAALAPASQVIPLQRRFLALGIHIAHGKYRWNQ